MQDRNYWVAQNITPGEQKSEVLYTDEIPMVSSEVAPFFLRKFEIISGHELRFREYSFSNINTWKVVAGTDFGYEQYIHQHKHNFFEMMIVVDGTIDVSIDNGLYHYEKGDVCLLNRNTRHSEIFKAGQMILYICFTSDYLEEWPASHADFWKHNTSVSSFFKRNLNQDTMSHRDYIDFYLDPRHSVLEAMEITDLMEKELLEQQAGCSLMLYALLDRLFARLVSDSYRNVYVDLGSDPDRSVFEQAQRYMDTNRRKLSRKDLSNAIFYNGDYINRIFMKYTKQSVREYNRYVYLKEAARLLRNSKLSVVEIANQVGFENRTQFNKLFRQQFGMLPKEYRDSTEGKPRIEE